MPTCQMSSSCWQKEQTYKKNIWFTLLLFGAHIAHAMVLLNHNKIWRERKEKETTWICVNKKIQYTNGIVDRTHKCERAILSENMQL